MAHSPLTGIPDDIVARAARIRLACFDVDGTLTDGRLYYNDQGRETKAFHVHDGQGLALLRRFGIDVALITARTSAATERRATELGLRFHGGIKDKLAQVNALCAELGIGLDEVAFVGDDLPDLPPMRAVGLAVAPANAHPWTSEHAHWQTTADGGQGAAREICDIILTAQGHAGILSGAHAQ